MSARNRAISLVLLGSFLVTGYGGIEPTTTPPDTTATPRPTSTQPAPAYLHPTGHSHSNTQRYQNRWTPSYRSFPGNVSLKPWKI